MFNITDNDEEAEGDSSDPETKKPASNAVSKSASKAASNSPSKTEARAELAHVFSIGHDSLLFEIWLEPQSGKLLMCIYQPKRVELCVVTMVTQHIDQNNY